MKVLLLGEGRHELEGALKALIIRLGSSDFELHHDCVQRADIHAHHGKGKAFFKRAVRWMLEARRRGYDAMILLIDQDKRPESIQELNDAQENQLVPIRRALGVAIRTFDAWMLADEQALTKVLGCNISRQPNPESIAQPKHVCGELLNRSGQSMKPREMYAAIAECVDLAVLRTRCPKGFAPFAQRVQELNAK